MYDKLREEMREENDRIDRLIFDRRYEKVKWFDNKRNSFFYKEWKKIKFKKGQIEPVVVIGNEHFAHYIRNFGKKYHCTYDNNTGRIEVFNHAPLGY